MVTNIPMNDFEISIGAKKCNNHVITPNSNKNKGFEILNPTYEKFLHILKIDKCVTIPNSSKVVIHKIMFIIKFLFS